MNKIYIISKYLVTEETGFETRFAAIGRQLVKQGFNLFLVGSNSNRWYFRKSSYILYDVWNYNGLKGITFNILKYRKTNGIRRIISWIQFEIYLFIYLFFKVKKGDLLVCSSLSLLTGLTGLLLKKIRGTKFLFDVRDIWPLTLVNEGGYRSDSIAIRFLQKIERLAYIRADLITGTMPRLDNHVKIVTGLNLSVHTVPFAPSPYLDYFRNPNRKKIGVLNDTKFNITYAGSINRTNALEFLIEAIPKINIPNVHFNIIGHGDLLAKFKEQLSSQTNVTFYGSMSRQDVLPFLEESNLLYFSSLLIINITLPLFVSGVSLYKEVLHNPFP